jgi:hypothetical protein
MSVRYIWYVWYVWTNLSNTAQVQVQGLGACMHGEHHMKSMRVPSETACNGFGQISIKSVASRFGRLTPCAHSEYELLTFATDLVRFRPNPLRRLRAHICSGYVD